MNNPDDGVDLDGPHWRYAVTLYGRRGVQEACLKLQDEGGVDVVLLLAVLFAIHEGRNIDGRIPEADAAIAAWRDAVIGPLRAIRRKMKVLPSTGPVGAIDGLRARVKAAELDAEQIEAAMLARWIDRHTSVRSGRRSDLRSSVEALVAYHGGEGSSRLTLLDTAIATIVSAAGQLR